MLETVEQGETRAMGQKQRGTEFGTFSSCWRKKLWHHDGVGRDVSQKEDERAASEG